MPQYKLCTHSIQSCPHAVLYLIILLSWSETLLVNDGKDTVWLTVNHGADEGVVKEWNVDPRNTLGLVLCLFMFQNHLDEQLLEFLVAVIDTELLEAVHTKHFKPVDVQHPDNCGGRVLGKVDSNGTVDPAHNQLEESLIDNLQIYRVLVTDRGGIHV